MTVCDEFIENIKKSLPEQCAPADLIKVGIYRSPQAANHSRSTGGSPPYFQLGRRIVYPREGVIQWLKGKKRENSPKETHQVDAEIQSKSCA